MKSNMVRRALTVAAALALAATAAAAANAIAVDPGEQRQGSLASFGPLMDNGFPTSYKDSHAVRLEACITAADPLCASAAGDTYDPDQPLSFPSNFPDEFFYQLASAKVPVPGNGDLLVENNLEGAFLGNGSPAEGQQVVFGRVRIRANDVPAGTTWRITHPYGVDVVTADAKKRHQRDGGHRGGRGQLQRRALQPDRPVPQVGPVGGTGRPRRLHGRPRRAAQGRRQPVRHQLHQGRAEERRRQLVAGGPVGRPVLGARAPGRQQRGRSGRRHLHRRRQRRLPGRLRVLRCRPVDRGQRQRHARHASDPDA